MAKILFAMLAGFILLAAFGAPASAQTPVTCDQTYAVSAGDWLSKLAEKYFGSITDYPALVTQTNLKSEIDTAYATIVNPDSINVGWKLCIPNADTANALNGETAPQGLEKTALANATYTAVMTADDKFTLKNGKFSAPAAPNTPLMTQVQLVGQIAYGELNSVPSAAVILGATGGGSGYFYSLHILQIKDGKASEVATTGLGDRSPVIALSVQDNQILVDMITQGPNQPMCCGNLRVLKWFKLEGNQLSVASHKELGNLGPNGETPGALAPAPTALKPTPAPTASSNPNTGLTGITWKWLGSTTSHGEIKPGDPAQYTVYFTRAEALVQADCNSGSAAYMVEGTAIKFGPIATTLIACGAGTQDSEFLKELQSAATYALQGADLSFGLASGGGTMRFGQ